MRACDERNIDLDRAEKRARALSGSDLTAFSLGTEADDDEPARFATSVDYGRADQAGLAAMIDEDDAMEAEPRRDGKRVRRASLGAAQVSLAISGLGSYRRHLFTRSHALHFAHLSSAPSPRA